LPHAVIGAATLWDRQNIYILSHEMAASNKLFEMVDLMQQKHPFPPQVGTDNAKELEFVKRGSSYQVATAGQKAGGRGGAISFFPWFGSRMVDERARPLRIVRAGGR
jgi:hypothetical protein